MGDHHVRAAIARAHKLSPERRSEIARKAANAKWRPLKREQLTLATPSDWHDGTNPPVQR